MAYLRASGLSQCPVPLWLSGLCRQEASLAGDEIGRYIGRECRLSLSCLAEPRMDERGNVSSFNLCKGLEGRPLSLCLPPWSERG